MSDDFPIVALLCSVGGLDALTRVLAPLPADLPAAIIALQHLEPQRASQLPELLDARTALPVAFAADGDPLVPGRVLVAPPGHHTIVTPERTVALIPSGSAPPYRPSADLLLTTLALAAGPRLIAVVLSGRGNDAATGASAVHRFHGTVIASTASTSVESAMPLAAMAREHAVDHVVPLDEVAELLCAIVLAPLIRPTS